MDSQIIVDFSTLDQIATQLRNAGKLLEDAKNCLSALSLTRQNGAMHRYSCDFSLKKTDQHISAHAVGEAIRACGRAVGRIGAYSEDLASAVQASATSFQQVEQNLQFMLAGNSTGEVHTTVDWSEALRIIDWQFIWDLVGSVGVMGPMLSVFGSLVTGGVSTANLAESGKYAADALGELAEMVDSGEFSFGYLTGIRTATASTKWTDQFRDELLEFRFGKAQTVSQNIKSVAKWAGAALTLVSNGIENFEENENKNRALAETVGESTVDIAEDIILTTIFTSLGATVGAPVVIVAGVTVLTKWGLDALSEHFTGEDLAENLSDMFLNGAEFIYNAFRSTREAISGWWNSIWFSP